MREEILNSAHLITSNDLARKYFDQFGIDFAGLNMSDFEKLKSLIQIEIDKLLADTEYQMITKLRVKDKIKKNKQGVFLRISGNYFTDREGISFNNRNPLFIGFCTEMSGCNRIPFITGFVKWVDFLYQNVHNKQ